jgi:hypothetical protein
MIFHQHLMIIFNMFPSVCMKILPQMGLVSCPTQALAKHSRSAISLPPERGVDFPAGRALVRWMSPLESLSGLV